jgi:hypothetical protein
MRCGVPGAELRRWVMPWKTFRAGENLINAYDLNIPRYISDVQGRTYARAGAIFPVALLREMTFTPEAGAQTASSTGKRQWGRNINAFRSFWPGARLWRAKPVNKHITPPARSRRGVAWRWLPPRSAWARERAEAHERAGLGARIACSKRAAKVRQYAQQAMGVWDT